MTADECVERAEWSLRQAEGTSVDVRLVEAMAQQATANALLALVKVLRERREDA